MNLRHDICYVNVPRSSVMLAVALCLSSLTNNFAVPKNLADIETNLFGIEIGSTVETLRSKYPGLYEHSVADGTHLFESCNLEKEEVFTFATDPSDSTRVAYVSARRVDDRRICSDSSGNLPNLQILPTTPRGVRLGAHRDQVMVRYGSPDQKRIDGRGVEIVQYIHRGGTGQMTLVFTLRASRVIAISLSKKTKE